MVFLEIPTLFLPRLCCLPAAMLCLEDPAIMEVLCGAFAGKPMEERPRDGREFNPELLTGPNVRRMAYQWASEKK